MKVLIAILVFFSCHYGATLYVDAIKELREANKRFQVRYLSAPHVIYTVYEAWGVRTCWLYDEIKVNCEFL